MKRKLESHDDWMPCDLNYLERTSTDIRRTPKQSSEFVGVCWCRASEGWIVQRNILGQQVRLGPFDDELKAAHASDDLLREQNQWHLKFNFPKLSDIPHRREAKRQKSKHGLIGIARSGNGWKASRNINGRQMNSRVCTTKEEACVETDMLWKKLGGDPAFLNFPNSQYEKAYFIKHKQKDQNKPPRFFSKYSGVVWDNSMNRWKAEHVVGKTAFFGGYYRNEVDCARRADDLLRSKGISHRRFNFPGDMIAIPNSEMEVESRNVNTISTDSGATPLTIHTKTEINVKMDDSSLMYIQNASESESESQEKLHIMSHPKDYIDGSVVRTMGLKYSWDTIKRETDQTQEIDALKDMITASAERYEQSIQEMEKERKQIVLWNEKKAIKLDGENKRLRSNFEALKSRYETEKKEWESSSLHEVIVTLRKELEKSHIREQEMKQELAREVCIRSRMKKDFRAQLKVLSRSAAGGCLVTNSSEATMRSSSDSHSQ